MFVLTIGGPTTMYFAANPSRTATDAGSFAKGTKIATYAVRGHDILNVQSPNTGIATATASLAQTQAGTFTLGSKQYRFGRVGLKQHLCRNRRREKVEHQPARLGHRDRRGGRRHRLATTRLEDESTIQAAEARAGLEGGADRGLDRLRRCIQGDLRVRRLEVDGRAGSRRSRASSSARPSRDRPLAPIA